METNSPNLLNINCNNCGATLEAEKQRQ